MLKNTKIKHLGRMTENSIAILRGKKKSQFDGFVKNLTHTGNTMDARRVGIESHE